MENKESGKTQEIVEVAEVEVNEEEEEEEWMTEEERRQGDHGCDLDPEQVRQGREEEMNFMVKTLKMFLIRIVGRCDIKNEQDAHDNEMGRSGQEGRQWKNIRQMQIGGARLQTKA